MPSKSPATPHEQQTNRFDRVALFAYSLTGSWFQCGVSGRAVLPSLRFTFANCTVSMRQMPPSPVLCATMSSSRSAPVRWQRVRCILATSASERSGSCCTFCSPHATGPFAGPISHTAHVCTYLCLIQGSPVELVSRRIVTHRNFARQEIYNYISPEERTMQIEKLASACCMMGYEQRSAN